MINSQIKTIGFVKEQDGNLVLSEYVDDYMNFDASVLDKVERQKIINYLNEGAMVFSTPLALFDGDTYIAPYMLFSDGDWIWTSHFAYYLDKLNFSQMTNEFLNHIRVKEYKIFPLSREQKTNIDIFIGLKLLNLSEKARETIRRNAIKLGYDTFKT